MKKSIKIIAIALVTIIILLIATPLLFEKQITEMVKTEINNSVNAKVTFSDLSISLLKNFPNATISISDLTVLPNKSFENDTLISVESIELKTGLMDIMEDKPQINSIYIGRGLVNLITSKEGLTNYDIGKTSETAPKETTQEKGSELALEIENYSLENIDFNYIDNSSNMKVLLKDINHTGSAELKGESILLDTESTVDSFSFLMDDVAYLNSVFIDLTAGLDLDLKNMNVCVCVCSCLCLLYDTCRI